jgi:hypothetical protein
LLAILVALFFALWDQRGITTIFLLTFLVASSKETAASIVIPLVLVVWLVMSPRRRTIALQACAVAFGSIIGFVSVLLFNVWKYGSIQNDHYTDPLRRVDDARLAVKNFLAIWISPSGGVLPFWFLGGLCALGVPLMIALRRRFDWRRRLAALLLLGILLSQTAILALWYAPFGWVTWGPRLILPIVGLVAIASIVVYESEIIQGLRAVQYRLVLIGTVAMTSILSGIASLGFILDRSSTLSWFNPPLLPACPQTANVELDEAFYLACALDFAPWQLGRTLWDTGLRQVTAGWAIVYVMTAIILAILTFAHLGKTSQSTRSK